MKHWLTMALGVAVVLCAASGARADERWVDPDLTKLKAIWPRDAQGALIYGAVKLDCAVGPKAAPTDCVVLAREKVDPRLAEAALKIAPLYRARKGVTGRVELDAEVLYDIGPDWLRKPTLNELVTVYPFKAAQSGTNGTGVISCWVKTNGILRDCKIIGDDPPGYGFGNAALVLQSAFLMKPAMRQGVPVEAEVSIPVNFAGGDGFSGGVRTTVLNQTIWAHAPSVPEIEELLDKKVGDRFADGKVVFQCELDKKTGRLSGCVVLNSAPGMVQFQGVARALTSRFTANTAQLTDFKNGVRVNLAFSFPDMTSSVWGKRYLTRPQWIRTIDATKDQKTFPAEAAKAGLTSGSATVDCVVGPDGGLTKCEVVSESAPSAGFGAMAQTIAATFAMNPWTEDGLPAEGAHVRLPIRMVDSNAGKGAAPAAKP